MLEKPAETVKILLSSLKNMKEIFCTLRVNFIRLYYENEKTGHLCLKSLILYL